MNKLQQLLKNPKCRFKTITEMVRDYGQNYMDLIMNIDSLDVVMIMSMYGGKKVYPLLVKESTNLFFYNRGFFRYGPTESIAHLDMLTTHAYPKFSSQANILKPGMLVTIEYGIPSYRPIVPSILRNAPGTTVRVLKVNKPSEYFNTDTKSDNDINKYCVATELIKSVTNRSKGEVEVLCAHLFKERKIVAFEIAWHLRKATEVERKFYYSQQHGADLVLTGK